MKGAKDGIEGARDAVLNIADLIDRGATTGPLLRSHVIVPYKLGGVLIVLLAHEDLVGHVLEVADELVAMSRMRFGTDYIDDKPVGSSRLLALGGIHRRSIVIAREQ